MKAPFRPFFLVAGLDAILGAAVWVQLPFGMQTATAIPAGEWHRNWLLFGTVPAMLSGFLLTALPRWTGRNAASPGTIRALLALWLSSRAAFVIFSPAAGLALAALFLLALSVFTAAQLADGGYRRNLKVLVLLLSFCGSMALTAASWHVELALRIGLASIVGLLAIIGGRVTPALTAAYVGNAAGLANLGSSPIVERGAALTMASALGIWIVLPDATLSGLLVALAACWQAMRVAQWRGWRSRTSAVVSLHAGYGWIVVGFALLSFHILAPASFGRAAALHAWTIGAIGTTGMAVMASMIRRHAGAPFSRSTVSTAAFASVTVACIFRLLAEILPGRLWLWATLSGVFWMLAFALFLGAFHRMLLPRLG